MSARLWFRIERDGLLVALIRGRRDADAEAGVLRARHPGAEVLVRRVGGRPEPRS